jgi:hypothetical protein
MSFKKSAVSSLIILINICHVSFVNLARFEYLNGLFENDRCLLHNDVYAHCKKIIDCPEEFEKFKNNEKVLKICNFNEHSQSETLICCPDEESESDTLPVTLEKRHSITEKLLDFNKCRQKHQTFGKGKKNVKELVSAILHKNKAMTNEDCILIHMYGSETKESQYDCVDGQIRNCEMKLTCVFILIV